MLGSWPDNVHRGRDEGINRVLAAHELTPTAIALGSGRLTI